MRLHNRWFQLVASLIAMIMIANLQYSWTLFVKPLQESTGWKLSDIQFAFTLFILFQTWVQPLDGWLIDRIGPRLFISAAGLLCGFGWAGLGYATTLPMLYTMYCIAGIGAAFVYSGSIGSALEVVQGSRGLASGHHGRRVRRRHRAVHPDHRVHDESCGYQAAFIATGIFQGVIILIVAQFLRHPPAEAAGSGENRRPALRRNSASEIHHGRDAAHAAVLRHVRDVRADGDRRAAGHGQRRTDRADRGASPPAALGAGRVAQPAGQRRQPDFLGLGVGQHRPRDVDGRRVHAAGDLSVARARLGRVSGAWFAVMLVLVYFTWGEIYSLFPAISADYFGTRHATSNYGVLYTAKGVASIIGSWVGALLFEQSARWAVGFYGSAVMALLAAGLAVGLRAKTAAAVPHVVAATAK